MSDFAHVATTRTLLKLGVDLSSEQAGLISIYQNGAGMVARELDLQLAKQTGKFETIN